METAEPGGGGPSQVGLTGCTSPSPQGPWPNCPPAGIPFPKALAVPGRRQLWALAKTTPAKAPLGAPWAAPLPTILGKNIRATAPSGT